MRRLPVDGLRQLRDARRHGGLEGAGLYLERVGVELQHVHVHALGREGWDILKTHLINNENVYHTTLL